MPNDLSKPEHVRRHEAVAANARRATVASADVMQTVALLGETVEDLKARLPIMTGLQVPVPAEWLQRIERRLESIDKRLDELARGKPADVMRPKFLEGR